MEKISRAYPGIHYCWLQEACRSDLRLEHTGLLDHYAKMLIALQLNSMVLLFIFGFLAMILANVMTNSTPAL